MEFCFDRDLASPHRCWSVSKVLALAVGDAATPKPSTVSTYLNGDRLIASLLT